MNFITESVMYFINGPPTSRYKTNVIFPSPKSYTPYSSKSFEPYKPYIEFYMI